VTAPGCPACGTQTTVARWDDVTGFECGHCRGHFIPAPELARFFDSHSLTHRFEQLVRNVRAAPESRRNLSCTHCHASLFRTLQVGVVEIEACASCASVYFDADEATRYLQQARFKASAGNTLKTGVDTIDTVGAIIDLLNDLIP
jgi:Zn-finger nucleic acid-binding protein